MGVIVLLDPPSNIGFSMVFWAGCFIKIDRRLNGKSDTYGIIDGGLGNEPPRLTDAIWSTL